MIEVVTDSAAMLPDSVRDHFGITVVPMIITVDGQDHREGVDLTANDFYIRMAAGAVVSTAAPAPGSFVEAYRAAAARGATEALSIHTGAGYSATLASATVASDLVDIPVTLVDTGVGSFPVALAVWAAAESLEGGASIDDAANAARRTASVTGSVFVVGVPAVARRGGRFVGIDGALTPTTVLELVDGSLHDRGAVADLDAAIDVMVDATLSAAGSGALRIGIGHAVHREVAEGIRARLAAELADSEFVIYDVGPSVGAHTGPGTLGIVHSPI